MTYLRWSDYLIFAGAGFKRHANKRGSTAHEPPSGFFPFQKRPLSEDINALTKEKIIFKNVWHCFAHCACLQQRLKKIKWSRYRTGVAQRVGRGIPLLFHDRGTRRGEWSAAPPTAALYPRERPATHFTWGWVGPRAGLDGRKISSSPGFDPGPSSP